MAETAIPYIAYIHYGACMCVICDRSYIFGITKCVANYQNNKQIDVYRLLYILPTESWCEYI